MCKQQAYDKQKTSSGRYHDTYTSQQRPNDVVLMSCACIEYKNNKLGMKSNAGGRFRFRPSQTSPRKSEFTVKCNHLLEKKISLGEIRLGCVYCCKSATE